MNTPIDRLTITVSKTADALGLMNALFDFAEKECGHNAASSRHALTTVMEWVAAAKAQLAAKEAEAGAMREALINLLEWYTPRRAEQSVAVQKAAEAALSTSAGADMLARLRQYEKWAKEQTAAADRLYAAAAAVEDLLVCADVGIVEGAERVLARLRAAEERNTALFGAARLVQESAFIGEAELRKQLTAAEEKAAAMELALAKIAGGNHLSAPWQSDGYRKQLAIDALADIQAARAKEPA